MKGTFRIHPRVAREIEEEGIPIRRGFHVIVELPSWVTGSSRVVDQGRRYQVAFLSGWNGSYHDCCYSPTVVVTAWGPGKFRRANRLARRWREELWKADSVDPVTRRWRARELGRSGD